MPGSVWPHRETQEKNRPTSGNDGQGGGTTRKKANEGKERPPDPAGISAIFNVSR